MNLKKKLESQLKSSTKKTLLGIGPVTKNTVDVAIEIANEESIPLMLIASRRQIDSEEMGGGYVNSWSTESFSKYVREKDTGGNVFLARDHGGPWQGNLEVAKKMTLPEAMEGAKRSFETDIRSGFDIIHIDPSIDIFDKPGINVILDRVFELYRHCVSIARDEKRKVLFEVGTDEQTNGFHSPEDFRYVLSQIHKMCEKEKFPKPTFIVAQTGTKVMETQNIGEFESQVKDKIGSFDDRGPPELKRILQLCNEYGIWLKEHNADYLSDHALGVHPLLGIHSVNVAPEFATTETRALLEIFAKYGLEKERNQIIQLANQSGKWEKWMLPNSKATSYDKAVISGHYCYSKPEFLEIKNSAQKLLKLHNVDLDEYLKSIVRESIMRYLSHFNLISTDFSTMGKAA